jgi:hypothetical protein
LLQPLQQVNQQQPHLYLQQRDLPPLRTLSPCPSLLDSFGFTRSLDHSTTRTLSASRILRPQTALPSASANRQSQTDAAAGRLERVNREPP